MATRSIASILHTLTSEEFVYSQNSNSNELVALVTECFTGNDEVTDNETNDDGTESKTEIRRWLIYIIGYESKSDEDEEL